MASRTHNRGLVDKPPHRHKARVLLVNKNPEELSHYEALLKEMRCEVRTSSSFAKGAQCLEGEPYDLVILDQGSVRFEGREVLMTAMEVDTELPVLVLARSYDRDCSQVAMQSGALDYVEGPLSKEEIVAFLETFVPPRAWSPRSSRSPFSGPVLGKKHETKALSNQLHPAKLAPLTFRDNLQL